MTLVTTLAVLATQNKRPSPSQIANSVILLPKIQGVVSRVKSYMEMATVVRAANPS
jgi:hypothetical protein